MKYRGGNIIPELSSQFLYDEMEELSTRPQDTFEPISEEDKATIRNFLPYWNQRNLISMWKAKIPEDKLKYLECGSVGGAVYALNGHYLKHSCVDYEKVLQIGLEGVLEEVETELAGVNISNPDEFEKMQYLKCYEGFTAGNYGLCHEIFHTG